MFKNLLGAKISTHTLTIAIGAIAFAAHHFFSDPQADAWLRSHWMIKNTFESVGATLIAYGIYAQPSKPAE